MTSTMRAISDSPSRPSRPNQTPQASAAATAETMRARTVLRSTPRASNWPTRRDRSSHIRGTTIMLASELASGMPQTPQGPYKRRLRPAATTRLTRAIAVAAQTCWSAKKQRVKRRITPLSASPSEKAIIASATPGVWSGVHAPRWKRSSTIGVASTAITALAGSSRKMIRRVPSASEVRKRVKSAPATARARLGNITVETATLKMPCGSM